MVEVNLDELNLLSLLRAAEDLQQRLETYQRHAAANRFRLAVITGCHWQSCIRAAQNVEAELTRLGLELKPADPLITSWRADSGLAVEGLREWLLEADASGLWEA